MKFDPRGGIAREVVGPQSECTGRRLPAERGPDRPGSWGREGDEALGVSVDPGKIPGPNLSLKLLYSTKSKNKFVSLPPEGVRQISSKPLTCEWER
ncbi:MAG: hypothetical protein ACREIA_00005, partial [Opitutaceae bacterium]